MISDDTHGQTKHYKQLTVEDGLPSNYVYSCLVDVKGYLWVSTDRGVAKYDGSHFQTFTTEDGLPTNNIWMLHEDDVGRIWVVNHKSLAYYIENDTVKYEKKLADLIPVAHYTLYYPSGIGTLQKNDFCILDSTTIKTKKSLSDANFKKKLLNLLIPLSSRMDQYDIEFETEANLQKQNFLNYFFSNKSTSIFGLMRYGSDFIYSNLNNQSIVQITPSDTIISYFPDKVRLSHMPAGEDSLIFIDHIDGSITYDLINKKFIRSIKLPEEFSVNRCIYHKGFNICGTKSAGLIIYSNQIAPINSSNKPTNSICISNGVKITTFNGDIYIGNSEDAIPKLQHTSLNVYFRKYHDHCYVMNSNIIYKFLGADYTTFNLSNSRFSRKKNTETIIDFPIPKLLHGFRDFKLNHEQFLRTGGVLTIFGNYQKGNLELLNFQSPPQTICTRDTIFVFNNDDVFYLDHDTIYQRYTNFLPNSNCTYLDRSNGFIEIHPKKKINVYSGFILENSIDFNKQITFSKSINDYLYIWAEEILFQIHLFNTAIKEYPLPSIIPKVSISDIEMNEDSIFIVSNDELLGIDTNEFHTPTPRFNLNIKTEDLGSNNFEISWSCNSIHTLGRIMYHYRLLPTDTSWSSSTNQQIQFLSLSPNKYQFELKVIDAFDNESKVQKSTFQIHPPWYKSAWFLIPASLIVLALIIYYLLNRSKAKLKAQEEQNKIEKKFASLQIEAIRSQMNPHFIFNALAAIQNYIRQSKKEEADNYLTKFALLIRKFLDYSQQNTVMIKDEIKLINSYVEIENLRFNGEIDYQLITNDELDELERIPSLLIQPFVENAIHHGLFYKEGEKKLTVIFNQSEEVLIIHVKDNGIGIGASRTESTGPLKNKVSKGMKMLKERFETINKTGNYLITYDISSSSTLPDTGTHIQVKIKLL